MTQLAKVETRENNAVTPAQMLQIAIEKGADLDRLEKLMDLQERWEAQQAKKAYIEAMAQFKANPPNIVKNKTVDFTSTKGRTTYNHATHDEVCNKITAALSAVGITHAWQVNQQENGLIKVTCTLTHIGGHSESTSMFSGRDDSGNKNSIQAIGSAVTYLQRYTLLSVTGLTTQGEDDDGKRGGDTGPISAEQAKQIRDLLEKAGTDAKSFCGYYQIEAVPDLPANKFKHAIDTLNLKISKKEAGNGAR